MPETSPIKLVCFDLGGVLVRLAKGWEDCCQRTGVALPNAGEAAWAKHHELMLKYETGEIDDARYLTDAPTVLGGGVEADAVVKVFDAWLIGMYPGAAELIDELKSRGLKTACLSNTNPRHWATLTRTGAYEPLQRLDYRLASHELRVMKPHEDAYRKAEAATGFWGEQVLFFDDRPENVQAARDVNWHAELVDRVDDAVSQIRDHLAAHDIL
jgi:HAD superfamily hydrolase (TIGR01509 family)